MLRMSLAAGGVALCLALPAVAQGSMTPSSSSMPSNDTSGMTCVQIMEKVKSLSIYAPGATMDFMQKEMRAAREARDNNDDAGCKMHATKALQLIKM